MPSFDTVSKIDMQEIDNAQNNVLREIGNRYDFKDVKWSLELDKKEKQITIVTESEYCLEQIISSLRGALVKRKIDPMILNLKSVEKAGGQNLRQLIEIKEGIDQDNAKIITKYFKQNKLKVQASIQGEEVRISGKSRDDLQDAMQQIKELKLTVPVQFVNFRD